MGKRSSWFGRVGLAVLIGSTGVWSCWILGRNAQWLPALRWTILAMTIAAIAVLLLSLAAPERRRLAAGSLAGSAAYALADVGDWVAATFAPIKVGSDTVYDLTAPAS